MIVHETERVRRLVGRLERGDTLPEAFLRLAREHGVEAGWVRALGAFESVDLCEYDQDTQQYRDAKRFDTPCEILSLVGNLSLKDGEPFAHLHATVSRERGDRVEVLGGHLVRGRVFACEFSLECFDDVVLERERDEATGLSLWANGGDGGGAAATGSVGEGGVTWDQVAQVSATGVAPESPRPARARRPASGFGEAPPPPAPGPLPSRRRTTDEELLGEHHPQRGDYIEHRQFGLCRVDGEDAEGALRIRLPRGVRKVIRLDVLEVLAPRFEGDRRVFPVRPRGKR